MKRVLTVFLWLLLVTIAAAESPWQFIIVGDSRSSSHSDGNGVNISILTEIANEIVRHDVDFVLFPGDLVNGGVNQATLEIQLQTWRDVMQPVYDANIAMYPVRGNHELGSPSGTTAWNNVFGGSYLLPQNGPSGELNLTYSVTHKNVFVIALDQYVTSHRVNQSWVDSQLAANTKPHIIGWIGIIVINEYMVQEMVVTAGIDTTTGIDQALPENVTLSRIIIEAIGVMNFKCGFMAQSNDMWFCICCEL